MFWDNGTRTIAVWVLTPNGLMLAAKLQAQWPELTLHCSRRLADDPGARAAQPFDGVIMAVREQFNRFDGHIFIMAAGIVMRAVGPLLRHNSIDRAVVVVDDRGQFAISLAAGHIGGANRLADRTAAALGATAVITTATDVNQRPAIDTLAMDLALAIENPAAIRTVNMALLTGRPVMLYDPHRLLADILGDACRRVALPALLAADTDAPGVYVADLCQPLPPHILILRPPTLVAGIGCNRGTSATEIRALLTAALADQRLSVRSLCKIASIDLKLNEPGLSALAQALGLPLHFYSADTLNQIHVPNPSAMAAKHAGVHSVCEAAAILAAQQGPLIVPKCKSPNTTVAIARRAFLSSASAPAVQTICPSAPDRCWPRPT